LNGDKLQSELRNVGRNRKPFAAERAEDAEKGIERDEKAVCGSR
jgi:hypothetical protein